MKIYVYVFLAVCSMCFAMDSIADETDSDVTEATIIDGKHAFFEALKKTLPGKWQAKYANGTFEDPTSEWRPVRIDYYLTAGDTAIVENYHGRDETLVSMTTVYHLDNNDIRATHFCGSQTHPRMIATEFDPESSRIAFEFVDVANLKAPGNYHSREIELALVDHDNVLVTFRGLRDGQSRSRVFDLKRIVSDSD